MARLEGANLWRARLEGANLRAARLKGANLERARLEGANLWRARLEGANLRAARLEGADLRGARLEGADLRGARLDDSTDLGRTSFALVRFRSVDLSQVRLSAEQIASGFGDGSVILPAAIDRPAHWPAFELAPTAYDTQYNLWRENPAAYRPPDP